MLLIASEITTNLKTQAPDNRTASIGQITVYIGVASY